MRTLRSRRVLQDGLLRPACLILDGARIAAVQPWESAPVGDLLDAQDLVVMPSLVDSHVHINEPGRTEWEGFQSATLAAAAGGVSVLADMPLNSIPVTTTAAALEAKIAAATAAPLWVDVALWGGVVPGNHQELRPMAERGVRGWKCFLCPSGIDEFPAAGEGDLLQAMPILRDLRRPLLVHAELEGPLSEASSLPADDYQRYLHSRPKEWEDHAVALIIALVRRTGARAHIVHLSSSTALPMLRAAKAEGLPITAETCPHYLCLRAEDVPPGATEWKCAPPIREGENRHALWAALADGTLDFVVTDHSPCVPALKLPQEGDFLRAWGGIASLQLGLASVATEARARGFGVQHLQHWMSDGPARLLGLPARGLVAGAVADLIAWDPVATFVVEGTRLWHRHPITPYQGRALQGRVVHHILRGEDVVRDGVFAPAPVGRVVLGARAAPLSS